MDGSGLSERPYVMLLSRENRRAAPHMADTLGGIQFKRGDYGDAVRLLREGAAKLADSPEVQFHVGMTQYATRRRLPTPLGWRSLAATPPRRAALLTARGIPSDTKEALGGRAR
jgi:hypothetical protein